MPSGNLEIVKLIFILCLVPPVKFY